jgi:putative PEP-CTERM system TPR-repeat lipoprotein
VARLPHPAIQPKGLALTKTTNSGALRVTLRPVLLAALLATALGLTGCGGSNEASLLASAKAHLAKQEIDAARLQIKNVLQKNPESGEARLMLGKLMFETGDMAGAESELGRALELGQPEVAVLPSLAGALVALQKGRVLVQRYAALDLSDPVADAELKTQLATAEAVDNDLNAAEAMLTRALRSAPQHAPALLLRARLVSARGDNAAALSQIGALLAIAPDRGEAWLLKGDLLQRATPPDQAGAAAAYTQAVKVQPNLVAAHNALVMQLLAKPDIEAASVQWTAMQKVAPKHPQTLLLEALLAEQKGDYKRAREITQLLLRGAPNNPLVLMLAGQTELKLNSMAQAEAHFAKAIQLVPKAAQPRRQLAQVQLRTGQGDKAMLTLRPLVDAVPPDAQAITLYAQAQLMTGDTKGAEASFARAAKLKPDDPRLRTTVALSQLGKGQDATALAELQSIASADKGNSADLVLITARMRRNDFDGALKAVDVMAAKMPGQSLPDQLRGRIALQRRDLPAARKHFEAALTKNADYLPALAGLAAMDLDARQPDAARARFEAVLKRDPKNASAMLALAEISKRGGGKPEDTVKWLEQAVKVEPSELTPHLQRVDHHLENRQAKLAINAAQAGLAALPDNAELLDRLGRAHLIDGDTQQAITAFNKLAALNPKSPLPQLRLADAQAAAKNKPAMAAAVRKASEIAPNQLIVQQAVASLAMMDNKPAQALAVARKVQTQQPDDATGFLIEADVEMRQKNWDASAAALRKALTRRQPGDAAQRLHVVLLGGKKQADADKMAADWRKSHPTDMGFVLYLGDIAMAANNGSLAEQHYRTVLDAQPDNVLALNNLAYVMASGNKPGSVALAERALKLAPASAAVLDTLAFSLAAENQLPRAIEVQTQAVAVAPDAGQFRLQLARLLLQSGNKPAARTELRALEKLGPAFARKPEVAEMIKTTGG